MDATRFSYVHTRQSTGRWETNRQTENTLVLLHSGRTPQLLQKMSGSSYRMWAFTHDIITTSYLDICTHANSSVPTLEKWNFVIYVKLPFLPNKKFMMTKEVLK